MPNPASLECREPCCTTYQRLVNREKRGGRLHLTKTFRVVDCDNCLRLHRTGMAAITRHVVKWQAKQPEEERAERRGHRDEPMQKRIPDAVLRSGKQSLFEFEEAYMKALGVYKTYRTSPPCTRLEASPSGVGPKIQHQRLDELALRSKTRMEFGQPARLHRWMYHLIARRACAYHAKQTWKGRK